MSKEKAKRIEDIKAERRLARQKVLAGFIERWLMAMLAIDNYYCHDGLVVNYDGDVFQLYYRPPRNWRKYMRGERYCPPKEEKPRSDNDSNPQRGNVPHDHHYLYGGD